MDRLGATAGAMGTELSPESLKVMALDLCHLEDRQIDVALARCRRESISSNGYPPKLVLGDILKKAGLVMGDEAESVEGVAAWDEAVKLAEKFGRPVGDGIELRRFVNPPLADCPLCTGSGMVVKAHGSSNVASVCSCKVVEEVPDVPERLKDSVARLGGWVKLKAIPPEAFPFRRRDFLAEYARWAKVSESAKTFRRLGAGEPKGHLTSAQKLLQGIIPESGIEVKL